MPGAIVFEVSDPGTPRERPLWVKGATETVLGYTHQEWMGCMNIFQVRDPNPNPNPITLTLNPKP